MSAALLYAIAAVAAGLAATVGYLLGLRRFEARLRRELDAAVADAQRGAAAEVESARAGREAAERALVAARAAAERDAAAEREARRASVRELEAAVSEAQRAPRAVPTITHTVLLDGVSNSGKSTLVHRLAFPCTDVEHLRRLPATQLAYRTRRVPVCFEPATGADAAEPALLHAQVFQDIAGEKPEDLVPVLAQLAAEREHPAPAGRHGAVVVAIVWDMANPDASRTSLTKQRLQIAYRNPYGRSLVRDVVVFFNKLDLLAVPPERVVQLVEEERAHVESVLRAVFGDTVRRTYRHGSALRGDGVIECQGAIYTALGLAAQFRDAEQSAKRSS